MPDIRPSFASNLPRALTAHRRTLSSASHNTSRKSSFQEIWAQDYYAQHYDDSAGENTLSSILLPPPPATLTPRPKPINITEEPCRPRPTQGHKRALTALLPFRSRANSRAGEKSPVKEKEELVSEPIFAGDTEGEEKVADKRSGLSSWFSGSSAPVTFGIPIGEQDTIPPLAKITTQPREDSPERSPAKLHKRSAMSTDSSSPTGTSRFNIFTNKNKSTMKVSASLDDEFLNLDLDAALFPSGREPCSPAAYNRILENAEALFLRMQTAYKLRTVALSEALDEKNAMKEDVDEAETRAEHLKRQLEDIASKAAEKDTVIESLKAELEEERKLRKERERSIILVKGEPEDEDEDLGIAHANPRAGWRKSHSSIDTDMDAETESLRAESIFSSTASYSRSCASPAPTYDSTPEICQASFGKVVGIPAPRGVGTDKPKTMQHSSTFQRLLKGFSSISEAEEGCVNCRGQNASMAWDTVGLLRAENKGLKEQVQQLEAAVDGALDVCFGVGI
ncbi:hypothetical protein F5884DRAFT_666523 [Xylogone sp. PMI_703]|nr:hypothetical protein F5884DRAFT_666523 [Xylogone sp. PMI_703]